MDRKIKVMVVDDSALMRKIISDMINAEVDMEVIDTARNGENLLSKINTTVPDVITLDVEMPIMDGITTLKKLKELKISSKIIMLSSLTKDGAETTMECLQNGAFDFIAKPSGSISLDINKVREDLIEKIRSIKISKTAVEINNKSATSFRTRLKATEKRFNNKINCVVIGASTGGPKALYSVITALPSDIGVPVLVVQHMPVGFTKAFAERLDRASNLKVVEAEDKMPIEKNVVYIAKAGYHMEVENNRIVLKETPAIWGVRPAVDKLFISASKVYGNGLLSVVLTGMGKDGAEGTVEVKKNGGYTFAEDESTCVIYGMPKAAFETNMVDEVLPLHHVSSSIVKTIRGVERG
ncbi:MAG: chemotaxis response regulator protein-glutamate methylesterase [Clostridium argentinense]|uniref:Protein-glutamate methylesterase/protein-glutamine glutaminase n=1 Tax=Clostridium faecium TaxID=2762223 RepID=A0ABR8YNZ5_9CLOT|nr:chemotaxis response regulator protein-glutamate methylesterase [Clostridium faecium]MBD8045974.1 chemotaxis response regulator protein-glutamate methylesterase [Clostridium faecium]MBS5823929.1 chemotaxis response regulator protein-glutamate methylesterase [Clostridium argentinense]